MSHNATAAPMLPDMDPSTSSPSLPSASYSAEPVAPIPGTTPSVGELSAEFAKQKRAKSPPLAFEKTSNDSLVAPATTNDTHGDNHSGTTDSLVAHIMGRLSPAHLGEEPDLQVVVDQQAAAMHLLHDAFAAERRAWSSERERLHYRIASLEKLLKTGEGYSPATSPILSPLRAGNTANNGNVTSPPSRTAAAASSRLPSIAEDESIPTLGQRRDQAPQSIGIPPRESQPDSATKVAFAPSTPPAANTTTSNENDIDNDNENFASPSIPADPLSPPPLNNRLQAGHTPLRAPPRPLTPPPGNALSISGIDDTPTRENTHANALLSGGGEGEHDGRGEDVDDDAALKGPLKMPELPNQPGETNFTFDMLSRKLELLGKNPDESAPMVVARRDRDELSQDKAAEVDEAQSALSTQEDDPPSPIPSRKPSTASVFSPPPPPPSHLLSKHTSHDTTTAASESADERREGENQREEQVQAQFESGGIRLKKKPSSNFGAPFGSLGNGFGRRTSHDVS